MELGEEELGIWGCISLNKKETGRKAKQNTAVLSFVPRGFLSPSVKGKPWSLLLPRLKGGVERLLASGARVPATA